MSYSGIPEYGLPPSRVSSPGAFSSGFGEGVWRDGKTLIMHKTARLPDFCIKCGSPAGGLYLRKTMRWHHPALALLVLAGLLIYLIVALIARKSATVDLSLCEGHLKKRRTAIITSWLIFAAGAGFLVLAAAEESGGSLVFGLLLLLASGIYAGIWAKIVTVKKIDDHFVWLRRIDERFLDLLPSVDRR